MSKPRVFISHGSHKDPAALAFVDRVKASLQARFAVLVDKDDIPIAADWRRTLNTWIGDCHAAVLLLSTRALERPWVAYEASILKFRTNCTVIPVFIKPVDYWAVQQSIISPAAIDANQAITADTEDEIIAKVNAALNAVAYGKTPIDEQRLYANLALEQIPVDVAEQITGELGFQFDDWQSDPRADLARALMSSDLLHGVRSLLRRRSFLTNRDALINLFHIIANSWVDERSTAALRAAAQFDQNSKAVGVANALRLEIAQCYVMRATGGAPLDSWKLASVDGTFDEKPIETLVAQVKQSLMTVLKIRDAERFERTLNSYNALREPVCVALPGAGLDESVLNELRTRFPTVTFIALAGSDANTRKVLERSGLNMLQPELAPEFEARFCEDYESAQTVLELNQ